MPRPYIEFIHSQHLPWQAAPPAFGGATWKVLSEDAESGAVTALLRFPVGHSALAAQFAADWELFVLEGRGRLGDADLNVHHYAYLPAAWAAGSVVAERDLVMLAMFSAPPQPAADGAPYDSSRLIGPIDTTMLKWDNSGIDPNINHLHASRKNLRLSPEGDCRTYLLGGMPQGFPPEDTPLETHPHVEEFFMVSGDMSVHCGIMRAGAYFWRPPGIPHGRDCTRSGYLLFCRTPGSNRTVSNWSSARYPVSFEPAHRPVLPPELRDAGAVALPPPVSY
jgi:hypothetical protein